MEELKRLINEDKALIAELDKHIGELGELLRKFHDIIPLFSQFFEQQAELVAIMKAYIDGGRK